VAAEYCRVGTITSQPANRCVYTPLERVSHVLAGQLATYIPFSHFGQTTRVCMHTREKARYIWGIARWVPTLLSSAAVRR
jgi:hypothetical protein